MRTRLLLYLLCHTVCSYALASLSTFLKVLSVQLGKEQVAGPCIEGAVNLAWAHAHGVGVARNLTRAAELLHDAGGFLRRSTQPTLNQLRNKCVKPPTLH